MASSSSKEQENVVDVDQGSGLFSSIASMWTKQTPLQSCQEQLGRAQSSLQLMDDQQKQMSADHKKELSNLRRTLAKDWGEKNEKIKKVVEDATKIQCRKDHKKEMKDRVQAMKEDHEGEMKKRVAKVQEAHEKNMSKCLRDAEKEHEKKMNERLQEAKRDHEKEMNKRLQAMKKEHDAQALAQVAVHKTLQDQMQMSSPSPELQITSSPSTISIAPNNDYSKTLQIYEKKIAALTKDLRKMQEAKLKDIEAVRWVPLSPSTVERKLNSIVSDIKRWADKYATFDVDHVLGHLDCISERLLAEGCISSGDSLRDAIMDSIKVQKPGKAAALLLSALVSTLLMRDVVGQPFFAFTATENSHRLRKRDGMVLQKLMDRIMESKSCTLPLPSTSLENDH